MVLLIIFMAAAPILQMGYDVALPHSDAGPVAPASPISVALDHTGALTINGEPVDRSAFESRLSALLAGRSNALVLFDAEDDALYADAVAILDTIRRAGGRIGVGFSD